MKFGTSNFPYFFPPPDSTMRFNTDSIYVLFNRYDKNLFFPLLNFRFWDGYRPELWRKIGFYRFVFTEHGIFIHIFSIKLACRYFLLKFSSFSWVSWINFRGILIMELMNQENKLREYIFNLEVLWRNVEKNSFYTYIFELD